MKSNRTKNTSASTPRIYVASLADYNAGRLLGRWINADQPIEDIYAEVNEMLKESKELIAEEWAIHDYEHFGTLQLCEFSDLASIAELTSLMREHGPVIPELVSYLGGLSELDQARHYMEYCHRGAFDSLADYAQDLIEDCYADSLKALPDFIRYHIDFDGIGRDIELSGDIFTVVANGTLHVFDAHG